MEGRFTFGMLMSCPVRRIVLPLCAVACAVGVIAGCSAKDDSSASKPASQVAVKVNKEEISVHQIKDLLARSGNIPQDQIENARSAVVERLIDQELLLQQAKAEKLDRNPNVMQAIEFTRRDILARAYGEQVASKAPTPTQTEIDTFYDKNPALFSARRIYNLQELNIQVSADRVPEVRSRLESGGGNLQQFITWLNEQKIPFSAAGGVKAAEQLPNEILKSLAEMKQGQAAAMQTPTGVLLLFVVGVQEDPVDRTKARPAIENFLLSQARAEQVKTEIKHLREAAAIQYVGDFKPPAAPVQNSSAAPAKPAATAEEDATRAIIEQGASKLR
jgi:EpsD family peptidyl-prolyl cis-trans isomerase